MPPAPCTKNSLEGLLPGNFYLSHYPRTPQSFAAAPAPKASQSFAGRSRQNRIRIRFPPGHVPGEKLFSDRKCGTDALPVRPFCARRAAISLAKTAPPFLRIYSTTPRQRRNLPAGKLGASRAASSGGNPFPPEAPQGLPAGTGFYRNRTLIYTAQPPGHPT